MLSSKDVLERTGISRATLNNYITTGLLPRPEVLPPHPDDGGAPRIGYFPDAVVQRIAEIQRLKREGWSLSRITAHFAGGAGAGNAPAPSPVADPLRPLVPAPVVLPIIARPPAEPAGTPAATWPELDVPAWWIDTTGRLAWANAAARRSGGPLAGVRDGAQADEVASAFSAGTGSTTPSPAAQALRTAAGRDGPAWAQCAVDAGRLLLQVFRSAGGALCMLVPAPHPPRGPAPAGEPALRQVAVLAAGLQDAGRLWLELPAREYFELVNELWAELEPIFQRHHGCHGPQPGDGLLCYFLPEQHPDYLWNALAAAHDSRAAMRQLSQRWRARKGWDVDLCLNTGVDEGLEWMGTLRLSRPDDLVVLGDAPERARALALLGRAGVVWVTRNLVGKLGTEDRARLTFGVPRRGASGQERPVLASFARLQDLVALRGDAAVPPALQQLAVTELVDLDPGSAAPPRQSP